MEQISETRFVCEWLEDYRRQVIANYDTTLDIGCRQAATWLRVAACRCLIGSGRLQHTALCELARAFELLGESYSNPALRIEAGRHMARARKLAAA